MKDNKKINKTRKNRGYTWESKVVELFNNKTGWKSRRLGSPSTHLPDVFAVNDFYHSICAVECKSTIENRSYVPKDQIERCIEWVNDLGLYGTKEVILAFKFGRSTYGKPRYYFKIFPHGNKEPLKISCDYKGNTFAITDDGKRTKIQMGNFSWN